MKKVSVLVAVYNSAKWLPRCLDSLCSQSYSNIEILCVDDASCDNSLQVLHEYEKKYSFIKVISLPVNSGPAVARNEALKYSVGDYILMVDSDDWLSADAIWQAVEVFEKHQDTDSVLLRLVYHFNDTGEEKEFINKCNDRVLDGKKAMRLALDWNIHGIYVARRWLYDKYPFDTSSLLYSDDNTARRHYLHSCKVRFCNGVYYYYQHGKSTLHNPGIRYADWLEATSSLKRMLEDENQEEFLINHIEARLWQNIVSVSGFYWRNKNILTNEERVSLLRRIEYHHEKAELWRLPFSLKCKFGFIPFKCSFTLFMLQERIYFFLRKAVKGI